MKQHYEEYRYGNLGFDGSRVSVFCLGLGGATVGPGPKCISDHLPKILERRHPSVVYLHIGENDFRLSHHQHPSVVASQITDMVKHMSSHVPVVYVSQLLSFAAAAEQKDSIIECNNYLKVPCQNVDTVQFWHHRGLWNQPVSLMTEGPRRNVFNSQGVHLSQEGQKLYWHSVRVAVHPESRQHLG